MANRLILNMVVNSHTNAAVSGTPAAEARFPYSLTIRIRMMIHGYTLQTALLFLQDVKALIP